MCAWSFLPLRKPNTRKYCEWPESWPHRGYRCPSCQLNVVIAATGSLIRQGGFMSIVIRTGVVLVGIAAFMTVSLKSSPQDSRLQGIPAGKTRVIDLSYAINDKLVPWPGDEKYFEAKINATVEKNG